MCQKFGTPDFLGTLFKKTVSFFFEKNSFMIAYTVVLFIRGSVIGAYRGSEARVRKFLFGRDGCSNVSS